MIKFRKTAVLLGLVCVAAALFCGCRNDKRISEGYGAVTAGCESASARESGEIMIYETIKPEKEIGDKVLLKTTETYIKYVKTDAIAYDIPQRQGRRRERGAGYLREPEGRLCRERY